MKSIFNQEQIEFIKEYYQKEGSVYCAEKLGFTPKQINVKASKIGVKVNPEIKKRNRRLIQTGKPKQSIEKYNVNALYFIQPSTPEASYLLGFLWADGYLYNKVNKISLELVTKDMDEIEHLFQKSGKWVTAYRERPNRQPQSAIMTNNLHLYNFLKKHDYESKHYISADKIIEHLPEYLVHYWFRGLFDGDGCIYNNPEKNLYQLSIAGSYEQDWTFIEKILHRFNIHYNIQRREQKRKNKTTTKSSVIRITNKNGIHKFANYIYNGYECDNIGLKRKYINFRFH